MARRKNKADFGLLGIGLLILAPAAILIKISDSIGTGLLTAGLLAFCFVIISFFVLKKRKRVAYLRDKYGDEGIVQKILNRNFWAGQTETQLRDSLGNPAAVDHNLLKTRKREVWKYQPNSINRYRLRITLDNDIVVSWDHKN